MLFRECRVKEGEQKSELRKMDGGCQAEIDKKCQAERDRERKRKIKRRWETGIVRHYIYILHL